MQNGFIKHSIILKFNKHNKYKDEIMEIKKNWQTYNTVSYIHLSIITFWDVATPAIEENLNDFLQNCMQYLEATW